MPEADVVVIGGGIVGLATARELARRRPGASIVVLEKETGIARHQTGRNSGVVHAGLYYKPGSLKARLCRRGKSLLESFAVEHGIRHDRCGKLVVATDETERARLHGLLERARANGVDCRLVGSEEAGEIEPHVRVSEAIHVPETGIIDYVGTCGALAEEIRDRGGEVRCSAKARALLDRGSYVEVTLDGESITSRQAVNCGGLQSDRIAARSGTPLDVRIIPFRGDYYMLRPEARHLCRGLIYPVPDPMFPFLGVHLTRMVDGGVECGPNAVLSLAREGYGRASFHPKDALESMLWPGLHRLVAKHWRTGIGELRRAWSRRMFAQSLSRLVPEITEHDLLPAESGNRAQALRRSGELVDDFVIERHRNVIHVINAPSPAATASLAIAEHIAGHCEPE
jgi:L-2-hydroxyglutarate oxidase